MGDMSEMLPFHQTCNAARGLIFSDMLDKGHYFLDSFPNLEYVYMTRSYDRNLTLEKVAQFFCG